MCTHHSLFGPWWEHQFLGCAGSSEPWPGLSASCRLKLALRNHRFCFCVCVCSVAQIERQYDCKAILDVGRSLQKVILHATRLGVATCWIGPGTDHRSVIAALGPQYSHDVDRIRCVCAIGYASRYIPSFVAAMQRFKSRSRLPLRALFFSDAKFHSLLNPTAPQFQRYSRCFEACHWAPSPVP